MFGVFNISIVRLVSNFVYIKELSPKLSCFVAMLTVTYALIALPLVRLTRFPT